MKALADNHPTNHICSVCGATKHALAHFCKSCKKLVDRIDTRGRKPNRDARVRALHSAWDGEFFRCFYTGWPLRIDNHRSPYYLTWEHRTPRDENDVVVAAALINDMKSDLTEDEFRGLVIGLAKRFQGGSEAVSMIDPSHYKR